MGSDQKLLASLGKGTQIVTNQGITQGQEQTGVFDLAEAVEKIGFNTRNYDSVI
jgi:hypothetical protein